MKICWNLCQIIGKDSEYAQLKLSSGEIRLVQLNAEQQLEWFLIKIKKY